MVGILLSVTFFCGLAIAAAHVLNRGFIAPIYDVVLNLGAFSAAVGSSALLGEWIPAALSGCAVLAWLWLGLRTFRAIAQGIPLKGQRDLR